MQQRLPSLLADPIAFAHRGAKAYAPENTLEAFALGLKLGANGLESDVWRTCDGAAVLDVFCNTGGFSVHAAAEQCAALPTCQALSLLALADNPLGPITRVCMEPIS